MTNRGDFKVKSSTVKYKNPWISVREDKVIRPDGGDGIFGIVTAQPGVAVIPVDEEGNIYMAKEFKYGIGQESIEALGGGIDKGEDKLEAAKRELMEESGIKAKKWDYLGFINPFTSIVASPNYMYLAQGLEFGQSQGGDEGEVIELLKMPFEEALEKVTKSEITHGATVVAILKAKERLGK